MIFQWFKRLLPRGLYGRAALILIVPILTIQLVVSIAFIQRYYSQVTRQMAEAIVLEIALIEQEMDRDPQAAQAMAQTLQIGLSPEGEPGAREDQVSLFDLSGRALADELHEQLPGLIAVDRSDARLVRLTIDRNGAPYVLEFDRRRTTARNPHQLLVILGSTGLMMLLVAFAFLRNQLRPVMRLARAAEAFGKGRTIALRVSGASEVRAAGMAFLDMRARIERQMESRTLMLSGISHDLRTPLTRLKLGLAMLEGAEVDDLQRDVDDMRKMIDGFLDFARADAHEEEAHALDPVDLARRAVENARRTGAQVELRAVEGAGHAQLRETAVLRALGNLIGNAVSYGTRAELSVAILERSVRFTIEDDGPGIPEDRREEAMKPFTRLVPGRNQGKTPGVGLGLAISADIARSHGGSLRLGVSERLGGLKAELVLAR